MESANGLSFWSSMNVLLGRLLLAWFFISQAIQRMIEWDAMIILVRMKHVPYGPALLVLAVILMITGGVALIIGYQTRLNAMQLAVCTIVWALVAHDYWTLRNPIDRASDYLVFALAVALIGGLLILVGRGGGRFSLDHALSR